MFAQLVKTRGKKIYLHYDPSKPTGSSAASCKPCSPCAPAKPCAQCPECVPQKIVTNECSSVTALLEKCNDRNASLKAEYKTLELQMQSLRDQLVNERQKAESQRNELGVKIASLTELNNQLKSLSKNSETDNTAALYKLNVKIQECRDESAKKDSRISELDVQLRKCQQDLVNAGNANLQEIDQLKEQIKQATATIQRLQDELSNLERLRDLATKKDQENELLKEQYERQIERLNVSAAEKNRLYSELETKFNESTDKLNAQIRLLNNQVNAHESTITQLQLQIGQHIEEIQRLTRELQQCQEELIRVKTAAQVVAPLSVPEKEDCSVQIAELTKYISTVQDRLTRYTTIKKAVENKPSVNALWATFNSQVGPSYTDAGNLLKEAQGLVKNFNDGSSMRCSDVTDLEQKLKLDLRVIDRFAEALANLYEDALSAVRTYIRVRPSQDISQVVTIDNKDPKSLDFMGACRGITSRSAATVYGPYFGIFPPDFKNINVYSGCTPLELGATGNEIVRCCMNNDSSAGVCRVTNQLSSGYSVAIFGYGYSGSGKSHSLFGSVVNGKEEDGMTQFAIKNRPAGTTVRLAGIYENAFGNISFTVPESNKGKFIKLYGGSGYFKEMGSLMTPANDFNTVLTKWHDGGINVERIESDNIGTIVNDLTSYRQIHGRIKFTPNNPVSSRSHLFLIFEFKYPSSEGSGVPGKTGRLILIDMGGRESTTDILDMFMRRGDDSAKQPWQLVSLMVNNFMQRDARPRTFNAETVRELFPNRDFSGKELTEFVQGLNDINEEKVANGNRVYKNLNTIIRESIFINDTVNQLVYFFKKQMGAVTTLTPNNYSSAINKPGSNDYKETLFLSKNSMPFNDQMGMYTALKSLKNLEDETQRPTKFVMMVHIRNEQKYCNSIYESLEFANDIKST